MGKIKLFVIIFMILLVLPLTIAAPPFQTGEAEAGLTITQPKQDVIKANTDVTVNIHVFNTTTGKLVTNDSTSCLIHLYNELGDHIAYDTMAFSPNNIDFSLDIDKGNFSAGKNVGFVIQCNTTNTGGFVSGGVLVTKTGLELTEAQAIIYLFTILVLIFLLTLSLYGSLALSWDNPRNPEGEVVGINYQRYGKIISIFSSYSLTLFLVGISRQAIANFLYLTGAEKIFEVIYWIMMTCMIPAAAVTFFLIIYHLVGNFKIKKDLGRNIKVR